MKNKKYLWKIIVVTMLVLSLSVASVEMIGPMMVAAEENEEQLYNFVTRMYTTALNREAEMEGVDYWLSLLKARNIDAATMLTFFLLGDEIERQNITDEEFVKRCYLTLFDREYDETGLKSWMILLDSGVSRKFVMRGFCLSPEFIVLCQNYEIIPGEVVTSEPRDYNPSITAYISRCYSKTLLRHGDADGYNFWAEKIIRREIHPKDVAHFFISCDEFVNQNRNNEEYIEILYEMFFNRVADEDGKAYWVAEMESGVKSREDAFQGFANSNEFDNVLAMYGFN